MTWSCFTSNFEVIYQQKQIVHFNQVFKNVNDKQQDTIQNRHSMKNQSPIVINLKQVRKLLAINWTSSFVLPLIEGDTTQWLLVVSSSHRSLNWHARCTLRSHIFGWILFVSITNSFLSVPVFPQPNFINWQFHLFLAACVLNNLCLHSLYLPVYYSYEFLF
jgi:hypothetical protein